MKLSFLFRARFVPCLAVLMTLTGVTACNSNTPAYCPGEARTSLDLTRSVRELFAQDPTITHNEMHPYLCLADEDTPAPKGYKPFYISHYGRHGSRTVHNDAPMVKVMKLMQAAYEEGNLTETGLRLYDTLMKVKVQTDGRVGMLTRMGAAQHAGIASRMYARFPGVFQGEARVNCRSTTVPRCIMSMANFTMTLKSLQPRLNIRLDCADSYAQWMNTKDPERTARVTRMVNEAFPLDDGPIAARIFKKVPDGGAKGFLLALFRTLAPGINLDDPVQGLGFFTEEEVMAVWARANTFSYMNNSNPAGIGHERMRIFTPLVDTIVVEADRALAAWQAGSCAAGVPAADLRFGHDTPLMTLISYFEFEDFPVGLTMEEVNDRFLDVRWLSKASNIQMIFYRKSPGSASGAVAGKDDILVKVLHNEGEMRLRGLTPVSGPYYRWSDLRQALVSRADKYR